MPVQMIEPKEVWRLKEQGKAVSMIDVRTPPEHAALHAEGTTLVPLDRLDPTSILTERGEQQNEPLYVICKSGARAGKACEKFLASGFSNVYCIAGGTDAWERAGLPVVRGQRSVISLERQVRIVAGLLVLIGVALGWWVHPIFFALAAFVGAGLTFAGITDWCGMGMLLAKMPWNR